MDYTDGYLQGKLLVAAPGIGDERFEKSVIYIYRHNPKGASGIVINKTSEHIDFQELCDQLSITLNGVDYPLYDGGPIEGNRGFVLHTNEFTGRDTENIEGTALSITTTIDVIKRMAEHTGPHKSLIALGCAMWGEGQLEKELTQHGWLYASADMDILFDIPCKNRWDIVIARLGIQSGRLAEYTGRA